jgi:hypothetical protein
MARVTVVLIVAAATVGCALQSQLGQMRAFADSRFRVVAMDEARLAGVDIRSVRRAGDIGLADAARIVASTMAGTLPLDLGLTIEATNRGDVEALMRRFAWKLRFDDVDVGSGESSTDIRLPASGSTTFPLALSTDIRELVRDRSREAIVDVAVGIVDPDRRPPRIALMIRPTFEIFGRIVQAPGYTAVPLTLPSLAVGAGSPAAPPTVVLP